MRALQFKTNRKQQRTVSLAPELDRWLYEQSRIWRCSFSETVSRMLSEHESLRKELASTFAEQEQNGTSRIIHVLLERFKEELCQRIDRNGEEIKALRSNKALLTVMDAQALQAMGSEKYNAWRREVTREINKLNGAVK